VDQSVQLFGPPTHVYAEVHVRRAGAEADDDAFVALTHAGEVRSHLWMGAVAGSLGPRFRILGLGGAFEKWGLDPQEAQLASGMTPADPGYGVEPDEHWGELVRGSEREPMPTQRGRYPDFYAGVASAIASGGPPPVDPRDAVATLEILESARRSAMTGTVVTLD
jgi:scyllo-inositol 2-dehydrogenase (NADP+)